MEAFNLYTVCITSIGKKIGKILGKQKLLQIAHHSLFDSTDGPMMVSLEEKFDFRHIKKSVEATSGLYGGRGIVWVR